MSDPISGFTKSTGASDLFRISSVVLFCACKERMVSKKRKTKRLFLFMINSILVFMIDLLSGILFLWFNNGLFTVHFLRNKSPILIHQIIFVV